MSRSVPSESGLEGPGPNLSDALLDLYECLTDENHFTKFAIVVGSWFADEHQPAEIAVLEKHADRIFSILAQTLSDLDSKKPLDQSRFVIDRNLEIISGDARRWRKQVKECLHSEDGHRLKKWMDNDEPLKEGNYETIVRIYERDVDVAKICYVSRSAEENGRFEFHIHDLRPELAVESLFRKNLNVTDAEINVLRLLVQGGSVSSIALGLEKSIETIRTQIKSISGKFSMSTQREIVQSVGAVSAMRQNGPGRAQETLSESDRCLTMPDGRKVFYSVHGKPGDPAMLFFHSFTGGRHLNRRDITCIKRASYRLILISRAGYGGSDPVNKTGISFMKSFSRDCMQVLLKENINQCVVLANGTGVSSAYTFCLNYPGVIQRLFAWDIVIPIRNHSDATCFLPGMYKLGMLAALYSPVTLKLGCLLFMRKIAGTVSHLETEEIMGLGPDFVPDFDPETQETAVAVMRDILRQKGKGPLSDCTCLATDWAKIDTPLNSRPITHIFQHNDNPILPLEATRKFADRVMASFTVVDGSFRNNQKNWPTFFAKYIGPLLGQS